MSLFGPIDFLTSLFGCMLVKLGKIMLKMRKLKHIEEKNFSFGKCVDVEKNGRYNKTRRR